ncbi:hypothetical protein MKW98_001444 [Papaver atlanticum]|uniref:Uncharacterized protein n=1 Tax=Papaver atlanticum TaxID=357466 RepID=A0AAD4XMC1_9MAGN|nr:hypothetical protein MKW98_001444 [Papaver atlanticum]
MQRGKVIHNHLVEKALVQPCSWFTDCWNYAMSLEESEAQCAFVELTIMYDL